MCTTLRNSPTPAAAIAAAGFVLDASALSAVNPIGAKAAMLYGLRAPAWNSGATGDVGSSSASLVAAHNGVAAAIAATAIRNHLVSPDLGGQS